MWDFTNRKVGIMNAQFVRALGNYLGKKSIKNCHAMVKNILTTNIATKINMSKERTVSCIEIWKWSILPHHMFFSSNFHVFFMLILG